MDVAAAEAVRAVQRGANRAEAAVLLGDIFAKRGLYGEALERYREARALEPQRADALLGEVKALFALGGERATEARALARSEERRVGKECRARWGADGEKKKRERATGVRR